MWSIIEQILINLIVNYPLLFLGITVVGLITIAFPEVWKRDFKRIKKFFI